MFERILKITLIIACNSPCILCTGPASTQCLTCIDGYYLNGTECKICVSPCSYCSGLNDCLTCVNGYYLNGSTCLGE